jgi:hypothetical protein
MQASPLSYDLWLRILRCKCDSKFPPIAVSFFGGNLAEEGHVLVVRVHETLHAAAMRALPHGTHWRELAEVRWGADLVDVGDRFIDHGVEDGARIAVVLASRASFADVVEESLDPPQALTCNRGGVNIVCSDASQISS